MEKAQCSQGAEKIVNIANSGQTNINADTVNVIIQQSDRPSLPAADADSSLRPYITNNAKTRYVLDDYGDEEEFEFYPDRLYVLSLYFITLSTVQERFMVMDYMSYAPLTKNGRINDDIWSVPYTLHLIDLQGRKVRKVREIKSVYAEAFEGLTPTLDTLEEDLFYNLGIFYKKIERGQEYIEYKRSTTEPDKMRCNYIREFFVNSIDSTGVTNLVDPECLHQHRYLPFSIIDVLPRLDGLYRFLDKPIPDNVSSVLMNRKGRLLNNAVQVTKSDMVYQMKGVLFKLTITAPLDDQVISSLLAQGMMCSNIGRYHLDGNQVIGVLPYGSVDFSSFLMRFSCALSQTRQDISICRCTAHACQFEYGKTWNLCVTQPSFGGDGYRELATMDLQTELVQKQLSADFKGILLGWDISDNNVIRFSDCGMQAFHQKVQTEGIQTMNFAIKEDTNGK